MPSWRSASCRLWPSSSVCLPAPPAKGTTISGSIQVRNVLDGNFPNLAGFPVALRGRVNDNECWRTRLFTARRALV